MLGQLTVIWKTGKLDLCGRKDFITITLMIGQSDFRRSKTFMRPKKFAKVKNTNLFQIDQSGPGNPWLEVWSSS